MGVYWESGQMDSEWIEGEEEKNIHWLLFTCPESRPEEEALCRSPHGDSINEIRPLILTS